MKNSNDFMAMLTEQAQYLHRLEEQGIQAENTLTGEKKAYYSGRLSVIREMIETFEGLEDEYRKETDNEKEY